MEYYVFFIDFINMLRGRDDYMLRKTWGIFKPKHSTLRKRTVRIFWLNRKATEASREILMS